MANEFKVRKGLIVQGSGSTILDILGSQGELFSVTDSLLGSLFSVNDISGIPIMEVFSDNTIKMGTFNQEAIIVSGSRAGMGVANPQAKLHISGANNDSLFRIQSPSSASIMFVSGSGNVGLGTLTPTATLEIASTGSATLGQAQIYLNTAAVGRNRIDFNTVGLGVPATTTRSDGTKITLYPAISATQTDIALGVAFPAGVGEFWSSVYASTISFSWYAAATQIMRLVGDGQLRLGAGTAALPVISAGLSGTDTNTGIYFPTADTIGLVTGGTERARITSAGSASIGTITSTPSATLHVSGANNVTLLRVASPGSADALVVSGSGNVGIGLTSPLARLHISGANSLRMQNTGFDTFEWFFSAGTGIGFRNVTDGTTPFFVGGTDDIGIGTTNTSAKLHVSGASNAGLFEIDSPAVNNIIYVSGSGNVGIGTNLPSADLHISGASADSLLRVGSPSNANILFVTGSGNVGINTTSPMAFFSGSGGAFGSGEGNIVPTLTIFQSSSATGLNAAGLQIVGSGSSALAAARLNILTMGDKYAYLNIGTSGSGTENNYWEFAKRPSSAVHSLLLSNYSNGVYQSSIMSLSPGANTSIIGSSDQILLEGSTGYIGLQTANPGTSDWIHLYSDPNGGNYLRIDAPQTSNPPPLTAATAKTGYGITTNAYYLAEPDYWMEIKLDGVIVLVPCYLPA